MNIKVWLCVSRFFQGESVAPSNHGSLCRVSGTLHSAWAMSPSPCISGQYCTPKSFSQFLSPMVLTCDSDSSNQPESGSTFNRFCPESQASKCSCRYIVLES